MVRKKKLGKAENRSSKDIINLWMKREKRSGN